MPILSIIFALSDMIAVGASVKVATALGEKKEEYARNLFSSAIFTTIGIGFIVSILSVFVLHPILFHLIKDQALAELAFDYIKYFIYALPIIMPLYALDNFLRISGKANLSMGINVIVSLLNIFLDWLFIVHFKAGIASAAFASIISMTIGAIASFMPFIRKKITLYFTKPKISKEDFIGIFYNGSSEFFGTTASSIIGIIANAILLSLGGSLAVASYSIVLYIDTFLIGTIYGITDSMQPAISYNNGANYTVRVNKFYKLIRNVIVSISLLSFAAIIMFPEKLTLLFSNEEDRELIDLTIKALLMFAPSYIFTWFNRLSSEFLTALDLPKESLIIMGFETIVFPLISLLILVPTLGVSGVFLAHSTSAALTMIISFKIWNKSKDKYLSIDKVKKETNINLLDKNLCKDCK